MGQLFKVSFDGSSLVYADNEREARRIVENDIKEMLGTGDLEIDVDKFTQGDELPFGWDMLCCAYGAERPIKHLINAGE